MGNVKTIQNPGNFEISKNLKTLLLVFCGVGLVTFLVGLKLDSTRTWVSFLMNHFYFLSLALGGIFFASIQWLTGAMWSAPIRRLSESLASYLPIVLLTFLVLYFGISDLYIWSHESHVKGDLILEGKSGYLSVGFFMVRNALAILVWIAFAAKMIRNSLQQDQSRDYALTEKNRVLSPLFLILFGVL